MFIKQISVFLENHNGALREMTELLGKGGVDLLALSVADTQNFGIIRIIVSSEQTDAALLALRGNGYIAKMNHVICAEVPDRPLGLCELLALVEKAGLSVEYMYSLEGRRAVPDEQRQNALPGGCGRAVKTPMVEAAGPTARGLLGRRFPAKPR